MSRRGRCTGRRPGWARRRPARAAARPPTRRPRSSARARPRVPLPSPLGDRTRGRLYAAPVRAFTGIAFIVAGTLHFTHTRAYVAIMPPYVPRHRESVLISGAAEIAGGVGVLVPPTRPLARWWLLALLTAVFPANVHMALN